MGLGALLFPILLKIKAPYGRHVTKTWGPLIPNRVGWVVMEGAALVLVSFWFWTGSPDRPILTYILYGLYLVHYLYRSLIFPFLTRTDGKKMPLLICVAALGFNFVNTFFIGWYLGRMPEGSFHLILLVFGLLLFIVGAFIHIRADRILIHLRRPGETGYRIPKGFLFKWISCPNHLGEIIEWIGFALMTGAWAGWSFALWTWVNLAPRARQHHHWYQKKFPDYPKTRKALIPHLW